MSYAVSLFFRQHICVTAQKIGICVTFLLMQFQHKSDFYTTQKRHKSDAKVTQMQRKRYAKATRTRAMCYVQENGATQEKTLR